MHTFTLAVFWTSAIRAVLVSAFALGGDPLSRRGIVQAVSGGVFAAWAGVLLWG